MDDESLALLAENDASAAPTEAARVSVGRSAWKGLSALVLLPKRVEREEQAEDRDGEDIHDHCERVISALVLV